MQVARAFARMMCTSRQIPLFVLWEWFNVINKINWLQAVHKIAAAAACIHIQMHSIVPASSS